MEAAARLGAAEVVKGYAMCQGKVTRFEGFRLASLPSPPPPMTVSYTLTSRERPEGDIIIVWEFTYTADSGLVDNVKGVINMHKVVSWVLYGRRTQM